MAHRIFLPTGGGRCDAYSVNGYTPGNTDGKLLVLPNAQDGQIIQRQNGVWVAANPPQGGGGQQFGACRVYMQSLQQIQGNSFGVVLNLNAKVFDVLNEYNTTSKMYIASASGIYLILFEMVYYSAAIETYGLIHIKRNNATTILTPFVVYFNDVNIKHTTGALLQLNQNDQIQVLIDWYGTNALYVSGEFPFYTSLNIVRLQ